MQTAKTQYPCVNNKEDGMNLQNYNPKKTRCFASVMALALGLSLAVTARAQSSGTINQLFAFTCNSGASSDTCPQGARPDLII
jgi:hypothetical protein